MRTIAALTVIALLVITTTALTRQIKQQRTQQMADISGGSENVRTQNGTPSQAHVTRPDAPPQQSLAGTTFKTYGYHNPGGNGEAVEGETWTFDHGGDPMEGWTPVDLTENDFIAWRFIDGASWAGHLNGVPAPNIAGNACMWLGLYEDEAQCEGYVSGLGYGNNWGQRVATPDLLDVTSAGTTLDFDYWYDTEATYDFVNVYWEQSGTLNPIVSFDGTGGTPGPGALHYTSPTFFPTASVAFRIVFEFTSDVGFSDEDGSYATTYGACAIDNIDVTGPAVTAVGLAPPYDFESGGTQFAAFTTSVIPGVGSEAGVADISAYTGLYDPSCDPPTGLSANAVEFHNGANQHPAGQREWICSPAAAVPDFGGDPLNVFLEWNTYTDMPQAPDAVFFDWAVSYYPFTCPIGTGWSNPATDPFIYFSGSPFCDIRRAHANDPLANFHFTPPLPGHGGGGTLVPATADSVRFYIRILSNNVADAGNFSAIFDNMRIGISNANTVLHVPSPTYPTIQEGIDAADPGDTVLVAAGTYTGALNNNLFFNGKDIVLLSEDGAAATIIDCGGTNRGMDFSTGETSASVVDGFTFTNGNPNAPGGALLVNSSPTFKNCVVSGNDNLAVGSGTVESTGFATYENCTFTGNTLSAVVTDVLRVSGGATFTDCTFDANTDLFGGNHVVRATGATFTNCSFDGNTDATPLRIEIGTVTGCTFNNNNHAANGVTAIWVPFQSPTFTSCIIDGNTGGAAVSLSTSGSATFDQCTITNNNVSAWNGAVRVLTGSPVFTDCDISSNEALTLPGGGVGIVGAGVNATFVKCTINNNTTPSAGGGVYNSLGVVALDSCTVDGNTAAGDGGGLYFGANNSTITNSEVMNNDANRGGGIYVNAVMNMTNVDIHDNAATTNGGGMLFANGIGNMTNLTVQANSSSGAGGGIGFTSSAFSFNGCLITGNSAATDGGGVHSSATNPTWTQCTIAGNDAGGDGGGYYITAGLNDDFNQSILWGNAAGGTGDEAYADAGATALKFDCSFVNPAEALGPGTITYVADNTFFDPQFCGAEPPANAPTTAGDYTVANNSGAAASNSPCGSQIGALGIGCSFGGINSIADVGVDQGRQVRIEWTQSMGDVWASSEPITQYSIWREVLPGYSTTQERVEKPKELTAPPGPWEFVMTIPASAQPTYTTVTSTTCDSTIVSGQCYSKFFVRAHTATPAIVYDSQPDSGYSVDNLEPLAPAAFVVAYNTGGGNMLSWDPNLETDLHYYNIYKSTDPGFTPMPGDLVQQTSSTDWEDPGSSTPGVYYKISAVDFSGNESDFTMVTTVTGVGGGSDKPAKFALIGNVPNPFNPVTTIVFDLPVASQVTVRIYDVSGQLVRTLLDEHRTSARHRVTWDAKSDGGHPVATGVYFYRVTAGEFTEVKRMTLLK